jgi:hypothetical protein
VRAGFGGVWITYFAENRVVRVDPATGGIVSEIEVGAAHGSQTLVKAGCGS